MKLAAKEQHAVKAMINLALNDSEKPRTLIELSRHQGISLSYLEQLFTLLRKGNLVKGIRGPGGGYRLSMDPNNITIAQILSAINDSNCQFNSDKFDEIVWNKFSNNLYNYLETVTLNSLIDMATKEISNRDDIDRRLTIV